MARGGPPEKRLRRNEEKFEAARLRQVEKRRLRAEEREARRGLAASGSNDPEAERDQGGGGAAASCPSDSDPRARKTPGLTPVLGFNPRINPGTSGRSRSARGRDPYPPRCAILRP